MAFAVSAAAVLCGSSSAFGAVADTSFGNHGFIRVGTAPAQVATYSTDAHAGEIVVAQVSQDGTGAHGRVRRFTRDGSLDQSFGDGGLVSLPASDIALAPADKLVVAAGDRVVRLNADGALDPTFGEDGEFSLQTPEGAPYRFQAVAAGAGGTIYASAGDIVGSNPSVLIELDSGGNRIATFAPSFAGEYPVRAGDLTVGTMDDPFGIVASPTRFGTISSLYAWDQSGERTASSGFGLNATGGVATDAGSVLKTNFEDENGDCGFGARRLDADLSASDPALLSDLGYSARDSRKLDCTSAAVAASGGFVVVGGGETGAVAGSNAAIARWNSEGLEAEATLRPPGPVGGGSGITDLSGGQGFVAAAGTNVDDGPGFAWVARLDNNFKSSTPPESQISSPGPGHSGRRVHRFPRLRFSGSSRGSELLCSVRDGNAHRFSKPHVCKSPWRPHAGKGTVCARVQERRRSGAVDAGQQRCRVVIGGSR